MKKRKIIIAIITLSVFAASTAIAVLVNLTTVSYSKEVERYAPERLRCLVLAVIKAESDFNPRAKSKRGAVGLMQIMPDTANYVWLVLMKNNSMLTETDLYNAELNIKIGVRYIEYLLSKFDEKWAICAYNAGEGVAKRWIAEGVEPKYNETRAYLKKVIFHKSVYEKIGFVDSDNQNFAKIFQNTNNLLDKTTAAL